MSEDVPKIELAEQDYSENPRVQIKYIGESKSALRALDVNDKRDVKRVLAITRNKRVQKWMDGVKGLTSENIQNWGSRNVDSDLSDPDWEMMYVVVGTKEQADAGDITKHEIGEVQGFVNSYSDADVRALVHKHEDLLETPINRESQIVELSVAKRAPAPKGQIAPAIRQACLDINTRRGRNVNRTSEKYSRSAEPQMIIVAFIDPANSASKNVFEEACFENRGRIPNEKEEPEDPDELEMYVLNWEKLNEEMHANVDAEFIKHLRDIRSGN